MWNPVKGWKRIWEHDRNLTSVFLFCIKSFTSRDEDPALFSVFFSPSRSWSSASSESSRLRFQLWRSFFSHGLCGGLLFQSAWREREREKNNSSDIKYNRGRKSRKSYRAGMNSFPFDLVPFLFNLLLSVSSRPESSLRVSARRLEASLCSTNRPRLCEPNTCSARQVLRSAPRRDATAASCSERWRRKVKLALKL